MWITKKKPLSAQEAVRTVLRGIERYQELHLCDECIVKMVAHDYKLTCAQVRTIWGDIDEASQRQFLQNLRQMGVPISPGAKL
jgi:hypothetical protein